MSWSQWGPINISMTRSGIHEGDIAESAMLTSVEKNILWTRAASFKRVQESHFESNWKGIYNLWAYIYFLNDVANLGLEAFVFSVFV